MATRNKPHGNAWSHHSPPKPSETTPRGERHDSSIFAHATFVRVWLTKNMGYIKTQIPNSPMRRWGFVLT